MRDLEVGNADRAHPSVGQQLLERSPGLDVLVEHRQRPMDKKEVEDVDAQLVHAAVEGGEGRVVSVLAVSQFGGDEQLVPWHVALRDRGTDTFFIAVALRSVDQPISVVGVANVLVVNRSMPDDLAYDITRLLFEKHAELAAIHPEAAKLTLERASAGAPAEYHPGAMRYFRQARASK